MKTTDNNTLPLFSHLPKLGHRCDVSRPKECTSIYTHRLSIDSFCRQLKTFLFYNYTVFI